MWIIAHYSPVALFSLKPAAATSSGGKTLLCPTPFSIKMALLDAAFCTRGSAEAKLLWPLLRNLRVRIQLPDTIVVINTFAKIVRQKKHGPSDDNGTGLITPFGSTIAYREYVQYSGQFSVALQSDKDEATSDRINSLLPQVNYFGKRGGFVQFTNSEYPIEELTDPRFIELTADQPSFAADGTLQMLDDCSPKLTFEQADIYSGKRITLGKDRILRHIVLPYRLTRSSKGFSLYERIAQ